MKKVLSLILVVALFASLALCVSADSVHSYDKNFIEHAYHPDWNLMPGDLCTIENFWGSDYYFFDSLTKYTTRIDSLTEGVDVDLVTCQEAITVEEMETAVAEWNACADEDHQIEHMTVYKQRKLVIGEDVEGVEVAITLWDVARKANAVLLAHGDGVWKIVSVSDDGVKQVSGNITGADGFAVCMTW